MFKKTLSFHFTIPALFLVLSIPACSNKVTESDSSSTRASRKAVLRQCAELNNQQGEQENAPHPKTILEPATPYLAKTRGLTGCVKLQYDITPDGETTNVNVVKAYPKGVYNKNARKAIKYWQFQKSVDGAKDKTAVIHFRRSSPRIKIRAHFKTI